MQKFLIFLIRCYQSAVSPVLGRRCRFYPTCSSFMIEAIEQLGPVKGVFTGLRRILRCHPFNKGGCDPLKKWIK
ncbi:MAG: membrane protein insertion efficiency factor YidD [Candidatus Omnitrophica bacterium]|nr:membrane protein insertion efficiency factor YidD [Candidatus Omnitrophota bacterium]